MTRYTIPRRRPCSGCGTPTRAPTCWQCRPAALAPAPALRVQEPTTPDLAPPIPTRLGWPLDDERALAAPLAARLAEQFDYPDAPRPNAAPSRTWPCR